MFFEYLRLGGPSVFVFRLVFLFCFFFFLTVCFNFGSCRVRFFCFFSLCGVSSWLFCFLLTENVLRCCSRSSMYPSLAPFDSFFDAFLHSLFASDTLGSPPSFSLRMLGLHLIVFSGGFSVFVPVFPVSIEVVVFRLFSVDANIVRYIQPERLTLPSLNLSGEATGSRVFLRRSSL